MKKNFVFEGSEAIRQERFVTDEALELHFVKHLNLIHFHKEVTAQGGLLQQQPQQQRIQIQGELNHLIFHELAIGHQTVIGG